MLCLAMMYASQGAYFIGVVQVVVYTGAVMTLILFIIMMVGLPPLITTCALAVSCVGAQLELVV